MQSVVLIHPAVDPKHDLTRALRHVEGHMFAIKSPGDWLVLGIGTTLFGTADGGVHTPGAGLIGFHKPDPATPEAYQKLVELPYQLASIRYGVWGGHITPMSQSFAREVLAPMLVKDALNKQPTLSP